MFASKVFLPRISLPPTPDTPLGWTRKNAGTAVNGGLLPKALPSSFNRLCPPSADMVGHRRWVILLLLSLLAAVVLTEALTRGCSETHRDSLDVSNDACGASSLAAHRALEGLTLPKSLERRTQTSLETKPTRSDVAIENSQPYVQHFLPFPLFPSLQSTNKFS